MKTVCPICPRACALTDGQHGFCNARINTNGTIIAENYGKLTALALDPIEKKPLMHFHPGKYILSAGSYGCNLRCPFCQNSDIALPDTTLSTTYISPEHLVKRALDMMNQRNIGIAYTYNEPLVGYEYVQDCAQLAHQSGLKNVVITNGYICEQPFTGLLPLIDAMNIDLKGFTQKFYDIIGGDLATVQRTIALAAQSCHVEVTTLIVPGLNDDHADMERQAAWLSSLRPDIPLHISRFFPRYHMQDIPPTPLETIYSLVDIAKNHLEYVYPGNC